MRLRTTTEPKDEELIQLIKDDPIGRNQELGYLVRLLDANPEGLSVFLNGSWGSGKSYFVRQAELLLRALNPNLGDVDGLTRQEAADIVGPNGRPEGARTYLPVHFNAWKHDAFGEPVLSLMCDIADMEGIRPDGSWDKKAFKDLLKNIARCVMKATLPAGAIDLTGEASDMLRAILDLYKPAEDPLEEYRARKQLDTHVSDLIRKARAAAGDGNKPADAIVMFVDELDRCRPSYAIEVLESIKHLLVRPDVIVVFAVDATQLAEAIRGAYGTGYDAERYLRRFYDVPLRLPEVDMASFANHTLGQVTPVTTFDHVAQELMNSSELVMRDAVQLCEMLTRTRSHAAQLRGDDIRDVIVRDVLCPLVCYLQITHQGELENVILRGVVSDSVCACANSSKTLHGILDEVMSTSLVWSIPNPMENHDIIRKEFLRDLLLVYLTNEGVRAREDALERLHDTGANLRLRGDVLRDVLEQWAE